MLERVDEEAETARQIEYTPWATKIKNRYANTHTHTQTSSGGDFGNAFFAPATCQIFAADYASGVKEREREAVVVQTAVCSMCVCVCPWEPTSRWQPDALLDGNIKQNDDVATLQMAFRVRRCQVPAAQVEVVYPRLSPHPYPIEQLHTLRCGEAGLDVGPIITRYTKQRPQAFRNALRRSQRQLRLKKSIKRQSTLREIERR